MRNRFEEQFKLGYRPIVELQLEGRCQNKLEELLIALKTIYCDPDYNPKLFSILSSHLLTGKQSTGRPGMNLWCIFVLAQVRMCLNVSYDVIHDYANNHTRLRWLMGIAPADSSFEEIHFSYQRIYDNVNLLTDEALKELNDIIIEFGHGKVFKKKRGGSIALKDRQLRGRK